MNRIFLKQRHAISLLCFLGATLGLAAPPALIPLPQLLQTNPGSFLLCPASPSYSAPAPAPTAILADQAGRESGEYLSALLFKSTGYRFVVSPYSGIASASPAVVLTTNGALASLGAEGYELTVTTNGVLICAPTATGLFYGVQTLLQLLPPEVYSPRPVTGLAWSVPCVSIGDWPRFVWRGWMMDSVRHFFNTDEVKRQLDTMAMHKLNRLHWHLVDDAGWRLEMVKWPLLHQVGAWRTNFMFGLNPRSSTAWSEDGFYGGYYTREQVREVVAYATQRHIMVVPEVEMPGHSTAALAAYPQFACGCSGCYNGPYSLNVTSYVGGVFCVARPETLAFLQDVLSEVIELFPSPYVHIGGDEVNFTNWRRHSLDQGVTNSLGTTDMQVYQSYFTQQIANWLKSQGRSMIGWSEIMNGGLVTNAVLMDWLAGSSSRALQAATNGQFAVLCPQTMLYINKYETSGVLWSNEPPAQSGFVPLSSVYAVEPIPVGLPAAFTNFILGAQGNSWSEFIPSLLSLEFKVYPRLSAVAEVDWTMPALKSYPDFTNRLATHKRRLSALGVNFNPSATPPQVASWSPAQTPALYSTLSWNITTNVTQAGEIDLSFCWSTGAHGLDIAWAALLENGVELDRDTHAGFTGVTPLRPLYVLRLPAYRPGAIYTLSASVQGRGGTDSTGIVYRPNWD